MIFHCLPLKLVARRLLQNKNFILIIDISSILLCSQINSPFAKHSNIWLLCNTSNKKNFKENQRGNLKVN